MAADTPGEPRRTTGLEVFGMLKAFISGGIIADDGDGGLAIV